MNQVKRFFGWLFLTDAYLATLTDEQIAVRAMGKRWAYEREQSARNFNKAIEAMQRFNDTCKKGTL